MKKITSDWHIHTEFSCDDACMEMEDLVLEQAKNGITDFGVSDHLHSLIQEDDIRRSKKAYDEIIKKHPNLKGHFHFGVEASVMSEWELERINVHDYVDVPTYGLRYTCPFENPKPALAINDEFIEKYGIEYVISGVHWPLESLNLRRDRNGALNEYFRQYLFAATHPKTDILAHFLWNAISVEEMNNNPSIFSIVTEQMRSELECALRENNTAYEVNLFAVLYAYPATFIDEYLGYVKTLQDKGIVLSLGSDCHDAHILGAYERANKIFDHYGIDPDKFWKL